MKLAKIGCAIVLGMLSLSGADAGGTLSWGSPIGRNFLTSDGLPWDASFRLEVGVFKNGFVPNATNTSLWASNWAGAQRTPYQVSAKKFSDVYDVTSNAAPFTKGTKGYIWGFRGSELSAQWVLLSKSDWTWIGTNSFSDQALWSSGSATAILGYVNGNTNIPIHIQSAEVTNALLPATSWAQWSLDVLGVVPPAGPSGDLNHNGIIDAWEFALHAPKAGVTPDPGKWIEFAKVGGDTFLQVRIPRRRDHPASFIVEVTSDLEHGPWLSGPAYTSIIEDTAAALLVRDNTPLGPDNQRRFLRVKVVVTP